MNIARSQLSYIPDMSPAKLEVLAWSGVALVAFALLVASVKSIRYRITRRFLVITWLGLPVRCFRLKNIAHVTPEIFFWAERWYNSFKVRHRALTIHRRTGLFRRVCISPKNRFIFRAELNRARENLRPRTPGQNGVQVERHGELLQNSVL